ncbi:hydroxyethylthiazole kinase, partial [Klebsiella pneumoniae]|nr:hydroxyethylthiazole kinase [Klebsiella pneumoniae]
TAPLVLSGIRDGAVIKRLPGEARVMFALEHNGGGGRAALPGDRLENVAAACGLMKQAGEIAARQGGPGSFIPAFLDALYQEVQG